jgi:hypothetical protein
MKVADYLAKMTEPHVTFIKARAREDAHTPFYHAEYQTTPLYRTWEAERDGVLSDYIILNDKLGSIDWLSGADWNNWIRTGMARCLLVISPEDMKLLYCEEQSKSMEKFIEERLDL